MKRALVKKRRGKQPNENIDMTKFFQLVKQHKLLYVPDHPDFRVYPVKDAVWKHIACQLGCSAGYAKKKWKYCREVYVRYRKTVVEAKLLGKKYKVWEYARDIEFVRPYTMKIVNENVTDSTDDELVYNEETNNGKKTAPEETRTPQPPEDDDFDDDLMEDFIDSDLDDNEVEFIAPSSPVQSTNSNGATLSSPVENSATRILNGATTSHSESSNDLQLDAIEMIFIGYSRTIKKFPLKQQSLLKFKIAELIMKAETELYQ